MKFGTDACLGMYVCKTPFLTAAECVAMVTAYYGQKMEENLARKILPQFFTESRRILHRCLCWGVGMQDTFLDSGKK